MTYSAVLSGVLQEWISQLELDFCDMIKCSDAGFKGAQQKEKRQRDRQGRQPRPSKLRRVRMLDTAKRKGEDGGKR